MEHVHSSVRFAMRMERERLQRHHREPFILPALGVRLLVQRKEHRQRCGRVALRKVDSRPAEGQLVGLRQVSGCR